jgi:nitroreductase
MEVVTMDVLEAIRGRRSIRKYNSDPISDEMLEEVLGAVRWSPSWANTQCWEVIVIREPEIKAKVAETLPPGNPALSSLRDAPVLLVFCAIRNLSGFKRGEAMTDKGDWFMFDIGVVGGSFPGIGDRYRRALRREEGGKPLRGSGKHLRPCHDPLGLPPKGGFPTQEEGTGGFHPP